MSSNHHHDAPPPTPEGTIRTRRGGPRPMGYSVMGALLGGGGGGGAASSGRSSSYRGAQRSGAGRGTSARTTGEAGGGGAASASSSAAAAAAATSATGPRPATRPSRGAGHHHHHRGHRHRHRHRTGGTGTSSEPTSSSGMAVDSPQASAAAVAAETASVGGGGSGPRASPPDPTSGVGVGGALPGDNNSNNGGSSGGSRGPTPPGGAPADASAQQHLQTAAATACSPPGLSGPTGFRFSPPCRGTDGPWYRAPAASSGSTPSGGGGGSLGGRYLTFLTTADGGRSSSPSPPKQKQQQQQRARSSCQKVPRRRPPPPAENAATADEQRGLGLADLPPISTSTTGAGGDPIPTGSAAAVPPIAAGGGLTATANGGGGGGSGSGGGGGGGSGGERRLCVIDLEPFTRALVREEREFERSLRQKREAAMNTMTTSTTTTTGGGGKMSTEMDDVDAGDRDRDRGEGNDEHDDDDVDEEERESERQRGEVLVDFGDQQQGGDVLVDFGVRQATTTTTAGAGAAEMAAQGTMATEAEAEAEPLGLPIADPAEVGRRFVVPLLRTGPPPPPATADAGAGSAAAGPPERGRVVGRGLLLGAGSNHRPSHRGGRHHHRHHHRNRGGGLSPPPSSSAAPPASSVLRGEDPLGAGDQETLSLAERLRRERQRVHSTGVTQFGWVPCEQRGAAAMDAGIGGGAGGRRRRRRRQQQLRILVPHGGNVYVQDGAGPSADGAGAAGGRPLRILYDKSTLRDVVCRGGAGGGGGGCRDAKVEVDSSAMASAAAADRNDGEDGRNNRRRRRRTSANSINTGASGGGRTAGEAAAAAQQQPDSGAIDPQLSPDGTMVAFVVAGEIYVMGCDDCNDVEDEEEEVRKPQQTLRRDVVGDLEGMDVDAGGCASDDNDNAAASAAAASAASAGAGPLAPVRVTYGAMSDDEEDDDDDDDNDGTDWSSDERDGWDFDSDSRGAVGRRHHHHSRRRGWRGQRRRRHVHPRSITHGLADFVAQEEMDRYRGFWWDPSSAGILFARVDETDVPPYRITHQGQEGDRIGEATYEDHRYPFAGEVNPKVRLGYVRIDRGSVPGVARRPAAAGLGGSATNDNDDDDVVMDSSGDSDTDCSDIGTDKGRSASAAARANWSGVTWFDPPPAASEYLARVSWLPDGTACAQWQDRSQSVLLLIRMDVGTGRTSVLHREHSDVWINLHHMMTVLPRAVHPDEVWRGDRDCDRIFAAGSNNVPASLPDGSFSFLFASERTGYSHLYLYTFVGGSDMSSSMNGTTNIDTSVAQHDIDGAEIATSAILLRAVTSGPWMVESIVGVDMKNDVVYVAGTYDSPLERHLYALPLIGNGGQWGAATVAADGDQGGGGGGSGGSGGGIGVRRGLKQVMSTLTSGSSSRSFRNSKRRSSDNGPIPSSPSLADRADAAFALAGIPSPPPPDPVRLTVDPGMHSVVMDDSCRIVVDTSSDLDRPTSSRVYALPVGGPFAPMPILSTEDSGSNVDGAAPPSILPSLNDDAEMQTTDNGGSKKVAAVRGLKLLFVTYDAAYDGKLPSRPNGPTLAMTNGARSRSAGSRGKVSSDNFGLPSPEILSFPTSDGSEILYAALYRPDPVVHGPGPYPLVCAVYGGPHVQRVNRSWCQCADMRAQRFRSLGFAVIKCDNRGSARRGLAFEGAIRKRLGRLEVLDQVTAVRHLALRGIADPTRVGIYGWSYGGYLAAMCLCRAPDVFHVAVAGAPVTSWDGYDTHYTERYMGLPSENKSGYNESAVFDHVPNMRGKLMIVHGLIDENVHFRHTARLINRLVAAGKDYDLLIFPDERHSPRRLRDRIYMEKRISDYFVRNLLAEARRQQQLGGGGRVGGGGVAPSQPQSLPGDGGVGVVRHMAGHL